MRRTITLDSGAEYPINISSRDNYLIIRIATNNVMFGSDNLNFKELSQSDVLVITKYQGQHVKFRNDNDETITVEFQFSDIPISIKERNMNIENAVTVDEILNPIDVDKILNPVTVEKIKQSVSVSGVEKPVTIEKINQSVKVSEIEKPVQVEGDFGAASFGGLKVFHLKIPESGYVDLIVMDSFHNVEDKFGNIYPYPENGKPVKFEFIAGSDNKSPLSVFCESACISYEQYEDENGNYKFRESKDNIYQLTGDYSAVGISLESGNYYSTEARPPMIEYGGKEEWESQITPKAWGFTHIVSGVAGDTVTIILTMEDASKIKWSS